MIRILRSRRYRTCRTVLSTILWAVLVWAIVSVAGGPEIMEGIR